MRSNARTEPDTDPVMGYFVQIRDEEGVTVHVSVDGNPMAFKGAVGVVAEFTAARAGNLEMKRMLLPETQTVGNRIRRQMLM